MEVRVSLVAVLGAAAVAMLAAVIWYSNVLFGKFWLKLAKVDKKKIKKVSSGAMVATAVLALLMAYVLAHVTFLSNEFFNDMTFQGAAFSSAFWMWVGFVVPVVVGDYLFNQNKSPWAIIAIQAGYWLVALLGMGLVIGQFAV